jgi:aromatic ring-cleaving dioxygenase
MKLLIGDVYLDASTARRTEQLRTQLTERISAATQERRKEFEKILQQHPGDLTTWLGKQLGLI